jgi:hypothetical protein
VGRKESKAFLVGGTGEAKGEPVFPSIPEVGCQKESEINLDREAKDSKLGKAFIVRH